MSSANDAAAALGTPGDWWFPVKVDAAYFARLRADYPEGVGGMDDDELHEHYGGGRKYPVTWDHVGDAYAEYEKVADAFFALRARVAELEEERDAWRFVPDEHGGHRLSVPTGDKWYPETFLRDRVAALEEECAVGCANCCGVGEYEDVNGINVRCQCCALRARVAALEEGIRSSAPHLNRASDLSGAGIAPDDGQGHWTSCHLLILEGIAPLKAALLAPPHQAPGHTGWANQGRLIP